MTDLTEQWKKGELPSGWYYVKGNRAEGIYAYTAEYLNNMYRPRNGEKIIEQVPSYEELQNINKSVNDLMASNIKLVEENIKLKELLKEAYPVIEFGDGAMMSKWEANWLTKAKEILGEDK